MISTKDILKKIDTLPALPMAVGQLSQLIGKPNTSVNDFEKAIKPDPSLTVNLLKICNSAYYRRSREVTSVKHAINMLGEKKIYEIVMTAAFSKVIPKKLAGYNVESSNFWAHNIAVAIISQEFAVRLKMPEKETIYTVGLLHDMGKLVVATFLGEFDEQLAERLNKEETTFIHMEDELLGTNHTIIGQMVADKWKLPKDIVVGVRWHHEPESCVEKPYQPVADIIHISNLLARSLGFGNDVGELSRAINMNALKRSGIKKSMIEEIASEAVPKIQQMQEVFESENGGN